LYFAHVTSNFADNFGNFVWLLRGYVAASTTWEIRALFQYIDADVYIPSPIIEITQNDWNTQELAVMPLPLRNFQALRTDEVAASFEDGFHIKIQARRTSGSGDLHLDCLMPIPVDEGYMKLDSTQGFKDTNLYYGRSPSGAVYAVSDSTGDFDTAWVVESDVNFYLPPGDGRMYTALGGSVTQIGDHVIFNDGDTGKYYERWLSLRGSE
jgi:hypothetical protein